MGSWSRKSSGWVWISGDDLDRVTGQNGIGQNGTDKMSRTK